MIIYRLVNRRIWKYIHEAWINLHETAFIPDFFKQKNNRTVRERFDLGLQMFRYTLVLGEGERMSGETSWPVEEAASLSQ
jgi:hypothetical protein